jgi:hypothetical protein
MASRPVVLWSWVLLALLAAHDLTHLLDDGLDTSAGQLALVAIPQWLAIGAVMAVILRGDATRSAIAALALGLGAAIGFAVVHLLPFAPAAYADLDPSAVSWVLGWVPPAVALVVAGLAVRELRGARIPAV